MEGRPAPALSESLALSEVEWAECVWSLKFGTELVTQPRLLPGEAWLAIPSSPRFESKLPNLRLES
jgi:hypothetical protein